MKASTAAHYNALAREIAADPDALGKRFAADFTRTFGPPVSDTEQARATAWANTSEGRECMAAQLAELRAMPKPQEPT